MVTAIALATAEATRVPEATTAARLAATDQEVLPKEDTDQEVLLKEDTDQVHHRVDTVARG